MSARHAPSPSPPPPPAGATAFAAIADRLEAVLDHETEALRHNRPCDLMETTGRKRQSLLELSRSLPQLANDGDRESVRHRLSALGGKLERNRCILDVRIQAVREVADIIARSLREAESDGTYSLAAGRP